MEHYIVSARKYRPSTFASVIGQKPLTAALKHAIATDRLAHAYLFCGSRGVGKTSCARIFAKTINCRQRTPEGEACNECESCRAFNENRSLNIIELDAASHNGIDDIKALIEQVLVPPTQGRYRVFIIDEVHMLSAAAFNSFLKTLEEPPSHAIFILATTEKHKIIPTILSRCQIYDFSRITIQDMVDHLQHVAANEGITVEPTALNIIARKADGAMRDALSIFDQVAASTMGQVTYEKTIANLNILDNGVYTRLVDAFTAGDVPQSLLIYQEVRERGFDSQFFINGLGQYLRDLMVAQQPQTLPLLEATDDVKAEMARTAAKCQPQFLYKAMSLCNDADLNFRTATNKQFLIELTLIKLCQLCSPSPDESGSEEGQLKPIAASATPAPAPVISPAKPGAAQPSRKDPAVTPPRPAPKPSVDTASQPRPSHRRMVTLSLHGAHADQNRETAPTSVAATHRTTPYTPEALQQAWKAFADSCPTERILVNTMAGAQPQLTPAGTYVVTVDDSIQVETLNEFKPNILTFIHDSLQNDDFDFTAEVRIGESSPQMWTQRQVLEHMLQKQPEFAEMVRTLSITL